ncbi:MAG: DNA-protecting protein DprA [Dictyoglomus sp. NZ13-RE01]|nr:MAG: DNA-protecting protein DprA [Dictyoglomus sp. NZ13-RE01]
MFNNSFNFLKEDKPYLYALSHFPPLFRRWREWINFINVKDLFLLSDSDLLHAFSNSSIIQEFILFRRKNSWEKFWEDLIKKGIDMVVIGEENYPPLLAEIKNPPLFLLYKGRLEGDLFISIVGTRKPTSYGIKMAFEFSKELASLGFVIVSGLAYGIDTYAHKGALEVKGKTWAVIGSGFDHIYPKENIGLAEDIVENGGAIISEYPLNTKPAYYTFPQRNRIISGISRAVLVVEAGEKSGALITAGLALDQGRDVYAIPGRIIDGKSKGTNRLIQDGAKMILDIRDILDDYGLSYEKSKREEIKLSEEEEKLLRFLSFEPKFIDEIAEESNIHVSRLIFLLISLQSKDIIEEYPGQRYAIKRSVWNE